MYKLLRPFFFFFFFFFRRFFWISRDPYSTPLLNILIMIMARLTSIVTLVSALVGATLASCDTNTGLTQMVTYVKRHPSYTREEFWEYWQTQHAPKVVPLSTHFNITRYQQVLFSSKILLPCLEFISPDTTE